MPEISVKDQLKKIIALQKVDGERYELLAQLKEKPAALQRLKVEFEALQGTFHKLQDQLKAVQLRRKEHELELKTKEDEIAKATSQLSQIKTNKEYSAKLAEIEHIKADKSVIEEKILLSFDESDKCSGDVEKAKSALAEEEKKYLAKKKEVEDDIKVIEDRVKVLEAQHHQGVEGVDPEILRLYERTISNKGGIAIVPLAGNTCGGCFMNVTSQQINAIKMNDQLVVCDRCTRILYIEDNL